MKLICGIFLSALSLTACASVQAATPLHEMAREDAPQWDLVSLSGLDAHLQNIYETGSTTIGEDKFTIDVFTVEFEELLKVKGSLSVFGETKYDQQDTVHINFSSCNGIMGQFTPFGGRQKYRTQGQTLTACWGGHTNKSGATAYLRTPMLVDTFFASILPDIIGYEVSNDSQILTLLAANDTPLGVFKRRMVAE